MTTTIALFVTAAAFVLVCGANDGASLLAMAVRHGSGSAVPVLLMLTTAVAAGPALFGVRVARTFTDGLIPGDSGHPALFFLCGAAAALVLVLLLTWRGIPTSITLAVLGGLAGAGSGLGERPQWERLGLVLGIAAAAPLAGAAAGFALGRGARRMPTAAGMPRLVRGAHLVAFGCQCLAYAANDGQKMFAVAAVASAGRVGGSLDTPPALAPAVVVALVFAAGTVLSLRRVSGGASIRLLAARPWQIASAEMASSTAVLTSAALGAPVSMTQTVIGGLVGAGASEGGRRVRWQFAVPLVTAWGVTLPAAYAAGLLAGLLARGVTA
ncbi:inorganic phosphate transporter [Streptomyces lancefieldiae]|uniref:Inorganic phosphate transporter n=1 Tax=Streptomyces lancefieldiae TaxID=3075520 RepID=A0ABU3AG00_9ACTN|nr:inorganic phosphate transporter [Streptomyces sp. DSM 40712]MDT0609100.1 inorganic phosphate transporter [Streptomyces sp. DSM 40712]